MSPLRISAGRVTLVFGFYIEVVSSIPGSLSVFNHKRALSFVTGFASVR